MSADWSATIPGLVVEPDGSRKYQPSANLSDGPAAAHKVAISDYQYAIIEEIGLKWQRISRWLAIGLWSLCLLTVAYYQPTWDRGTAFAVMLPALIATAVIPGLIAFQLARWEAKRLLERIRLGDWE